ncbi:MAG TPA: hypothetical protein VJV05_12730 [Pyrinomonadaceae bacterium]|nr:hypothetical protein [Pyrinomonadaceae bacterium]
MSSSEKTLAEKIARLLESETQAPDLALLYASIDKLNHRLDKIEASIVPRSESSTSLHPSVEKFSIAEAIADEIFAGLQKEKACTFEPNGKPCDHCAMCNSRGF